MPTTNALLVYRTSAFGPGAPIQAALGGVPIPQPILSAYGLLLTSDVTVGPARTINLGLVPTSGAAVHAHLLPGATADGSPVKSLTIAAAGTGYAAPPYLQFVNAVGDTTGKGAKGRALLNVDAIAVTAPGSLYAAPVVTLVGGLAPTGVAATATAAIGLGGTITGITVVTPGSGYIGVPTVVITDALGAGATAVADLNVSAVALDAGGGGYQAVPTVNVIPAFKMYFPDGPNQVRVFNNLFTAGFQKGSKLQLVADVPIVS